MQWIHFTCLGLITWGDPPDTVICKERFVIGLVDRRSCIISWAVFDPLTIDIEVHQFIRPIDLSCRPRRDQDLLPSPPVLRIDDKVMDAPIVILQKKVFDVTNLAVTGVDMVPGDRCGDADRRGFVGYRQYPHRIAQMPRQVMPP